MRQELGIIELSKIDDSINMINSKSNESSNEENTNSFYGNALRQRSFSIDNLNQNNQLNDIKSGSLNLNILSSENG